MSGPLFVVEVSPRSGFLPPEVSVPIPAKVRNDVGTLLRDLSPPPLPSHFSMRSSLSPSSLTYGTIITPHHELSTKSAIVEFYGDQVLVMNGAGKVQSLPCDEAFHSARNYCKHKIASACRHLLSMEYGNADRCLRDCANIWKPFEYWVATAAVIKLREDIADKAIALRDLYERANTEHHTKLDVAIDAWSNSLVFYVQTHRNLEHPNPIRSRDQRFEAAPFCFDTGTV